VSDAQKNEGYFDNRLEKRDLIDGTHSDDLEIDS
jgi:hypothetical protein